VQGDIAKTLQKGQLITVEGTLRYREVEDDVKGTTFKHRIAEVHANSMKRLSERLRPMMIHLTEPATNSRIKQNSLAHPWELLGTGGDCGIGMEGRFK
jgi:single-stranded DNA-binding protein